MPGLYFLGLSWQHTRGSALLGWVKDDAEFIAEQIAASRAHRSAADLTAQETRPSTRLRRRRVGRSLTDEKHVHDTVAPAAEHFPTETAGLPESPADRGRRARGRRRSSTCAIAPVAKRHRRRRPSACSPTTARSRARRCACREGSELDVNVANEGDLEATVHWHGLRLDNRYDGTHETQAPIPVGGSVHVPHRVPRPGRLLVPPAHPRGLRPGAGPVREHRRRPGRAGLLAAGAPRGRS